jgi:hypothetical protein
MPLGSRRDRIALGFALTAWIAPAGCQSLPTPRPHPAFQAGAGAESPPTAPVPADPVAAQAPLPPLPTHAPEPTPLLDAALARSKAQREALFGEHKPAPPEVPPPSDETPRSQPDTEPQPVESLADAKAESPPPVPAEPKDEAPKPAVIGPTVPATGSTPETPATEPPVEAPEPSKTGGEPPTSSPEKAADERPKAVEESVPDHPAAAPVLSPRVTLSVPSTEDGPLAIADLRLCQRVLGFGVFEAIDPLACKAGSPLIVYCEMAGLRYESHADAFRSRLTSSVEVIPEGSPSPAWQLALGTVEDLCSRRRRDYYVNYRITLPKTLAPGSYELRLTQKDAIGDRTATRSVPLTIHP